MKKFLSLLLALTLVLSLVVVPARAHDETGTGTITITGTASAKEGEDVSYRISGASITYGGRSYTVDSENITNINWSGINVATANQATYAGKAGASDLSISCTADLSVTVTVDDAKNVGQTKDITVTATTVQSNTISVPVTSKAAEANAAFKTAVAGLVKYANRATSLSGNKITAYRYTSDENPAWSVASAIGDTYSNIQFQTQHNATVGDGSMTITGTKAANAEAHEEATSVTATFSFEVLQASITASATPTPAITGGTVALSIANGAKLPSGVSYAWSYAAGDKDVAIGSGASANWTLKNSSGVNLDAATYVVKCEVKDNSAVVATSNVNVTVEADGFGLFPDQAARLNTIYLAPGQSANLPDGIMLYAKGSDGKKTGDPISTGVTYSWDCSNSLEVKDGGKIYAKSNASTGNYTLTRKAVYKGKTYTQAITVTVTSLSKTLSSVANGSYQNYYISALKIDAAAAIAALPQVSGTVTVSSISVKTQPMLGSLNTTYINSSNSYVTYTAPKSSLGQDKFVTTVVTNKGTFEVTFVIPVIPIYNQTFEAQYPQAVSSVGNSYNYTVTPPTGYDRIALITKGTTPTTAQLTTSPAYNSTSITLNSSDFNTTTGKCTLYVMAWNSNWTSSYNSGKYYYGPLEVYQKNYNINYNGVAGETVQFAQSDFTDFMNEVAEARGDASKTKSYPYVTFDYVTFSLPTTSQGTLYYGNTAMSTSNSSGAFNTRTKVTNLDSVTFVPNAKTTAKTITLNFTLYATRYSSSSTSHGTTVPYSGTVVVNLVREDIKYTVSQGDSVRFDESDFLNYLRSTKGYSSNNTIDYVTFDQSAVSAVNEGSLYTYYNGYNYGGSVKTTDKFYYSATASQNALSDVAFLASRYAKTGETVYIPFTIYARYGTTGTGTRQLTGTVAIKIGQTMNFIDVKTTDYFYNSVKWAVGKNITNGTSSTTFSPYKSCTRAEIVTFLWRAAGSPEPTITRNPFRDVNAVTHSSYYKAILWASQKGITSGTSATAFSPDQVCTRAQIVTFLYRYAGQPSGYYSNPFKDVGATSEASYYNAILWAVGKGITTGTSATTFSPYASCNRAEAVTFLYRYTNGL